MLELPDAEKSVWRDIYKGPLYPKISTDLTVDTVIIGAGITGLTAAYLLKQEGQSVAVLDKDTIGGGTSGRTTGKVTSQHGLIYSKLRHYYGDETARVYADANQSAIDLIEDISKKENINCDWKKTDNYVFTSIAQTARQMEIEAKSAREMGLPAEFVDDTPLPFEVVGAIKFKGQGKIHLQKYLLGLARAVNGNGSYVFEGCEATTIRDSKPSRVVAGGRSIYADNIIVATNVPTLPLIARSTYCALEYPTVSYAIAAKAGKKLPGMYISPDKNHYSIMPVNVSGEKLLLIVGAGGHLPGLGWGSRKRHEKLAAYAEEHFSVKEITHRWSDRDYISYDNIPLVGKLYPWSDNLYVGTAFKKWGITNGTVAAGILRDLITGKKHTHSSVYDSTRLRPLFSIPGAFVRHFNSKN